MILNFIKNIQNIKLFILIFLLLGFFLFSKNLYAQINLAFIIPEGENDPEQALPYLNQLQSLLIKNGAPNHLKVTYIKDVENTWEEIKKKDIHIIIPSIDYQVTHFIPTKNVLLYLRMIGSPEKGQYFHLLSHRDNKLSQELEEVFASRKIDVSFLNKGVMTDLKVKEIDHDKGIFSLLRRVGKNGEKDWILLDDYEFYNFKKLKFDWAKNIKVFKKSNLALHSSIIVCGEITDYQGKLISDAFKKLNKNKEAKELLNVLRIDSFMDLFIPKEAEQYLN